MGHKAEQHYYNCSTPQHKHTNQHNPTQPNIARAQHPSNAFTMADDDTTVASTYEATMARQSTHRQPDRIHWERGSAWRDSPYRQLHHQKGLTGFFKVRLLEAAELERSYWSALAIGPVKHLGLSKAHGPVSSYCTFTMDTKPHISDTNTTTTTTTEALLSTSMDSKMPATNKLRALSQPTVVSPVVPQDDSPVWSDFHFELPLRKGSLVEDGMRIFVKLRVDEDSHVAERIIPGLPKGDDRLIGKGEVDVTSLCLGETLLGQSQVGVLDAWVPIYYTASDYEQLNQNYQQQQRQSNVAAAARKQDPLKQQQQQQQSSTSSSNHNRPPSRKQVGRVRVLISYRPNGLDPKPNDVVALESFARRNTRISTCAPILPPLSPMIVKEVRSPYLLVEYQLPVDISNTSQTSHVSQRNSNNNNYHKNKNRACMRVHRNAVFVIERQNLMDATVGLALLPADALMSTPVGQVGAQILGPAVNAGREVLMPAMLSFKLVFTALRTTGMAGLTGVQAAAGAIWHQTTSAWANQNEESQYHREQERARSELVRL